MHALAQPLLVTIAMARPRSISGVPGRDTPRRLGEVHREHPAALAGVLLTISEGSGLPLALMPQCRPLARNPDGAVTTP